MSADLSVRMSLTLADSASGPLRAFTQLLEQLKVASAGIAKQLDGVTAAIAGINRVAGTSSITTFTAGVERMGVVAGEARGGTAGLEQAMAALGATLSGVAARVGEAAAGLGLLGTEARAAGAGVRTGAAAMESGLVSANTQANTLTSTLKGLGQLYAAMKIEKGLKVSAEEAINYQATQTRMAAMGMSPAERAEMTHAADAASRAVPQFNKDETLSMAIDLRNATGSVHEAISMLQPFAVAAFNMKMATPAGKTFAESDMLLIAKALEQRGATMDPVKMQAELSMMERIYTATQGRVDAQQLLGNIQYAKGGLGQTMDLSFLPIFAAMIEQIKSAGGNGGQIGTALTSLQQSIINGTGSGQAQKERARLGLLDPDKLVWNKQGNIDQQKSDLKMAGAEEFQRNPYLWIQNYLKPAMVRAGIDLTNDAAVNQTLNKLFPNRNAANIAGMMTNRGALLEKDAANINQSKAGQEARDINVDTAKANIQAFKAQLENLGMVLGASLLPVITAVAKAFTMMFQGLAAFFTAVPAAATFMTYALAIGAVVLAVNGFRNVFGILGTFASLMKGAGAATTAAAASSLVAAETTTVASATIASRFTGMLATIAGIGARIASVFLRMIPWVGALLLAWDFAQLIGNIKVGTDTIAGHLGKLCDWAVERFRSAWQKIGEIVRSTQGDIPVRDGPRRGGTNAEMRRNAYGADGAGAGRGSYEDYDRLAQYKTSTAGGGRGSYAGYDAAADAASRKAGPKRGAGLFDSATAGGGGGSSGRAGRAETEPALGAIRDGQEQQKSDFLRSEKAVYTDLDKIMAGIDSDAKKRSEDARKRESDAYREEYDKIAQTRADYADRIAAIDDKERNGILSRTAAEAQKLALIKEEAAALDVLIEKQRQMPGGTAKDEVALTKLATKNQTARDALPSDEIELLKTTQSGFQGFFKDILGHTQSAENAFRRFGKTVENTVTDIVSKKLGDMLYDSLFGAFFPGANKGGGGGLASAFSGGGSGGFGAFGGMLQSGASWLSSAFGGGSAYAAGSAAGAGFGTGASFGFQDIGAFLDDGTDYVPHDMLAIIHKGEQVKPADYNPNNPNNRLDGGGAAGATFHNTFVMNGATDRRSQGQIVAEIQSMAQRQTNRRR